MLRTALLGWGLAPDKTTDALSVEPDVRTMSDPDGVLGGVGGASAGVAGSGMRGACPRAEGVRKVEALCR